MAISTTPWSIVRELGERADFAIVNSINPDRIAGQKTAAFEIVDDLGDAPDFHLLPLGQRRKSHRLLGRLPRISARRQGTRRLPAMIGFQAAGAAPIFHGRVDRESGNGRLRDSNWKSGQLESGEPGASKDSKGAVDIVTDEEILAAQQMARHERRNFRGARQRRADRRPAEMLRRGRARPSIRSRRFPEGSRIVCTVTGHGLKDPEIVGRAVPPI